MKLNLDRVTIIAVATNKRGETIASIRRTLSKVNPARTILFTDIDIVCSDIEVVETKKLDWNGYNKFIVKELYKYIKTDFVLIVQHDSWVLNENVWTDDFYNYDCIGAKWMYTDGRNIANGGFSFRSRRLQNILGTDEKIEITTPEDEIIGRLYRGYLEKNYDIKFATEEIADKFSFELNVPTQHTFGFHNFYHKPYKDCVVLKRAGAFGDVVMLEPVMEYYYKKGYDVYVDTQPQYMNIFYQHNYQVKHVSHLNKSVKPLIIDLDMSYEKKPKQLALKSYYETCGISDGEIRNSKLFLGVTDKSKIFKNKYVIIHSDDTGMPYRNAYGIDWGVVTGYLKALGYDVFQVGRDNHISVSGAIHFNTASEIMLLFLLKGADFLIGIDSGVAQISVALGVPSIIMAGSVNLNYRYTDLSKIKVIQNDCDKKGCYHEVINSEVGQPCVYNKTHPPCTQFSTFQIIGKIQEICN